MLIFELIFLSSMLPYVLVAAAVIIFLAIKFSTKKTHPLKAGDYAMLKSKYKTAYPNVPTMFALKIEQIDHDKAVVIFIHSNNKQVCKETLPVYALSKAV